MNGNSLASLCARGDYAGAWDLGQSAIHSFFRLVKSVAPYISWWWITNIVLTGSYWYVCETITHTLYTYTLSYRQYIYIYVCVSCTTTPQLPIHGAFHSEFRYVRVLYFLLQDLLLLSWPHDLNWTKGPYFRSCPKHLVLNRRRRSFHNASATIPASRRILTSTVPPSRPCSSVAWGCGSMWEDIRGCDYRNS